ncbi:MAG: DNA polymerase/3'-5' exonuclease PolX [Phycisphaerae bacterium]|nr:DNA polymerase/3'-5' exonuclease PolX [Phycisphaerae bacterium]
MPIPNSDIADMLNQTADLLEIQDENPFRVRAYRNASRTVRNLSGNAAEMIAEGTDLTEYQGIGKDLAGKIGQIVETGAFDVLTSLRQQIPGELDKLMHISGLGAKRVARLYKELDITNLEQLKQAVDSGRIRDVEGFGKKTEDNIREEIGRLMGADQKRLKIAVVEDLAAPLVAYLKKGEGVKQVTVAGSFRRRKDTVGDLDILVTCKKHSNIMDHFTRYEDVQKIVSKGATRSTVLLRSNFQVDVRVMQDANYGAALMYFTGSKEHNIAVRKIGLQKKLKLNEYGLFRGEKRVAGRTESEVYARIGLPYIEPELRENRGEVEAAQANRLPKLVKLTDIKGDLHVHTNYTDGHNSIREMAEAAKALGYSYVAITDHSQHLTIAGGLQPDALRKQMEEIEAIDQSLRGITLLKGTEVDILENGTLDWPSDLLADLDVRVCSIHHQFTLSKEQQTTRILKAMDNPYFNILGHPTGRLIQDRQAYAVDMERIMKAAAERGCLLEVNAHSDRLDLNDIHCKMAAELGVTVVISTDSHRTSHLENMRLGVGQARRGWLEAGNVANTRTLGELRKLLKPR